MQFDVIDTKTGAYPDVEKIALTEDWAKGLIYCDIDCFAIQEDGNLILIDDCWNIAYPPEGRFKIVPEKEQNEALPVLVNNEPDREYIDYICPRCKDTISQRRRGQRMETVYQCKYHDNCGQRVDWTNPQPYRRPKEGEEDA